MCGIAGLWKFDGSTQDDLQASIRRMTRTLALRGPDDEGYFTENDAGFALGHRRLSIVDLSAEGHQPMTSPSGRYVMAFNGEVYNHQQLRAELTSSGFRFRGHSDTEAMLAAIEHWGLRGAVDRFVGMFAFALWDRKDRVLSLVRDRVGIKPVYFGWTRGGFVFGSELKAIVAAPDFNNPINRDAIAAYLRFSYVPAPWSIFQNVYKLRPGTILIANSEFVSKPRDITEMQRTSEVFWSAREIAERAASAPFGGTKLEAQSRLEELLSESVRCRMIADVPLGALLSGGVDSSTVVAMMRQHADRPVRTFSIGFSEHEYDEARHAMAVARHLGTEHTELHMSAADSLTIIPQLPAMYDEPFADPSQIPTFLVSKLARTQVTVALSGDGGDELFGGYARYSLVDKLWRTFSNVPLPVRRRLARILKGRSARSWDALFGFAHRAASGKAAVSRLGNRLHRLADVLADESPKDTYRRLVTQWADPAEIVSGSCEPASLLDGDIRLASFAERMMWTDFVTYLTDDILTKVDRASMAASLEVRVPILDHRVVEFAWHLPLSMKIHHREDKWLLRQVLYRHVPRALIERPKQGFSIPLEEWLRGPLREWGEGLLDERRLRSDGYFDPTPIRKAWTEHVSGYRNWHYHLWSVLMFQSWLEQMTRNSATSSESMNSSAMHVGSERRVVI